MAKPGDWESRLSKRDTISLVAFRECASDTDSVIKELAENRGTGFIIEDVKDELRKKAHILRNRILKVLKQHNVKKLKLMCLGLIWQEKI